MTDQGVPSASAAPDALQVVRRLALDLLATSQPSQTLEVAARQVRRLLGADGSLIALRSAPQGPLTPTAWDGLGETLAVDLRSGPLLGDALLAWRAAERAETQGSVVVLEGAAAGCWGVVLAAPLRRRKEAVGVMLLFFTQARRVDRQAIYALESSAALVAAALDNVRLLRQERERHRQTAILLEVAHAATSARALEVVLQEVAEKTAHLAQADRCSIFLLGEDGETLQPSALSGVAAEFLAEWRKFPLRLSEEPLSREALEHGQPVVVTDPQSDPRTDKGAVDLFGDRSLVVLPLLGRERRLGTLFLNWVRERRLLSPGELQMVGAIAAQATVAIENAWLHAQAQEGLQEVRSAYRQLRALQETASLLSSTLDPQEVLDRIVWGVVNGLGYDMAALAVLDEAATTLSLGAIAAAPHLLDLTALLSGMTLQDAHLPLSVTDNLAVNAVLFDRVQVTQRLPEAVVPLVSEAVGEALQAASGLRWFAIIPLSARGEKVGAFFAASRRDDVGARELEALQAFGDQGAMAIHNAWLYARVSRSQAQYRDLLAETQRKSRQLQLAFRQLSMSLASAPDLDDTLQTVAGLAAELLDADLCALWLPDRDLPGHLLLAAVHGQAMSMDNLETLRPWVEGVLRRGRPLQSDRLAGSLVACRPGAEEAPAGLLCVPLALRDETVGVLCLCRRRTSTFSAEEVALSSSFAQQAAVAIERARLFASVVQEKQEVEAVLRHTADGIMIIGPDGLVTGVNPALEDLLGLPEAEIVGRPCREVFCPQGEEAGPACPLCGPLQADVDTYREQSLWDTRGRKVPVGITYGLVRDDTGALVRLVAVIRDISRQQHLDRVRSDFVSAVSHELRTPLALVKGYAATLLREDLTLPRETQTHFLRQLDGAADRLGRLIDDLLTVSRLESGGMEIDASPMDLRLLILEIVQEMQQVTRCSLQAAMPQEPLPVWADAGRLRQVLTNLLGNATKFSPPDGVVTVGAAIDEGSAVHVWVHDQGLGIPPQHLSRLFEKFYRVERTVLQHAPGLGLGLYIAKNIVQAHGGEIWAESEPGQGSTFHFRLPSEHPGQGDAPQPDPPA
ncbi:MAG: GAF domain-containing protein [Chloroflexi bacterium]|nr:GAF domain-containing protein [Chloroflexota bacterium]